MAQVSALIFIDGYRTERGDHFFGLSYYK